MLLCTTLRGTQSSFARVPLFMIDMVGVIAFFNATGMLLQSTFGLSYVNIWLMLGLTICILVGLARGLRATPLSSLRWWRWH